MRWGRVPVLSHAYGALRSLIMARGGLQPFGEYSWRVDGAPFHEDRARRVPLPNLSGALDSVIRQCMDAYGLGGRCLLVSESNAVKDALVRLFPAVAFVTCDCFPELMPGATTERTVDVLWDVTQPPPAGLADHPFGSVLCHALLEHVIAPTTVIVNLLSVCRPGGLLYLLTCTPSFFRHRFPRDYVRFHHDYFEDLPRFLERRDGTRCTLLALHSREGLVRACYRKE